MPPLNPSEFRRQPAPFDFSSRRAFFRESLRSGSRPAYPKKIRNPKIPFFSPNPCPPWDGDFDFQDGGRAPCRLQRQKTSNFLEFFGGTSCRAGAFSLNIAACFAARVPPFSFPSVVLGAKTISERFQQTENFFLASLFYSVLIGLDKSGSVGLKPR